MPHKQCSSCKVSMMNQQGAVEFPCPQCSKQQLVRCHSCRKIGAVYTCPGCGFSGPN